MPTSSDSFAGWVDQQRAALASLLEQRLATPADGDPGRLVEAMRYSLLAPGKRIRPLLALAAAETAGGIDDNVRLAAASVELVHCYSLIHDDLPAMDDDDFRRGQPSNHKAFGEATAILAGDALLTLAFEWMAEAGERAGAPERYLRASLALARGAGARGMVRGQARDLGESPPDTLQELEVLHAEKTAALFRAALEVGARPPVRRPTASRSWRVTARPTESRSSTPTTATTPSTTEHAAAARAPAAGADRRRPVAAGLHPLGARRRPPHRVSHARL